MSAQGLVHALLLRRPRKPHRHRWQDVQAQAGDPRVDERWQRCEVCREWRTVPWNAPRTRWWAR